MICNGAMALVQQACFNRLAELTTVSTVTLDPLSQNEGDKEQENTNGDRKIIEGQGDKAEKSTWNLIDNGWSRASGIYCAWCILRDPCCPGQQR